MKKNLWESLVQLLKTIVCKRFSNLFCVWNISSLQYFSCVKPYFAFLFIVHIIYFVSIMYNVDVLYSFIICTKRRLWAFVRTTFYCVDTKLFLFITLLIVVAVTQVIRLVWSLVSPAPNCSWLRSSTRWSGCHVKKTHQRVRKWEMKKGQVGRWRAAELWEDRKRKRERKQHVKEKGTR